MLSNISEGHEEEEKKRKKCKIVFLRLSQGRATQLTQNNNNDQYSTVDDVYVYVVFYTHYLCIWVGVLLVVMVKVWLDKNVFCHCSFVPPSFHSGGDCFFTVELSSFLFLFRSFDRSREFVVRMWKEMLGIRKQGAKKETQPDTWYEMLIN